MDDLLLQKYLRNETSEEELVEVLDWLDASTENQRYLDRLDYISNLNILAGEAQRCCVISYTWQWFNLSNT